MALGPNDVRLPFKEARIAIAKKVQTIAIRVGHTQLAEHMDVALGRIEREGIAKANKGRPNEDFISEGDDHHNQAHVDNDPGDDADFVFPQDEGVRPLSQEPSQRKKDKAKGKEKAVGKLKRKVKGKVPSTVPPPTRLELNPPQITLRKGPLRYVRDMVEHELEKEVERRIQERTKDAIASRGLDQKHAVMRKKDEQGLTEGQVHWREIRAREQEQEDMTEAEELNDDLYTGGDGLPDDNMIPSADIYEDHNQQPGASQDPFDDPNNSAPETAHNEPPKRPFTSDPDQNLTKQKASAAAQMGLERLYRVPTDVAHDRRAERPKSSPMHVETIYRVQTEAAATRWGDLMKARHEREEREKLKAEQEQGKECCHSLI